MLTALVLTVIAGILGAITAAMNAYLAKCLHFPSSAAIAVCVSGLCASLLVAPIIGISFDDLKHAKTVPWWAWLGGALGVCGVFGTIYAVPKIGVASYSALTITSTLIASMVIDHYGLLNATQEAVTSSRLVGATLLLSGCFFMIFK